MDTRVAVLDLGTNTFHLLIADIAAGTPQILYTGTIAVKLGEGGITDGTISHEACRRGLGALSEFRKQIDYHQVTRITGVATSAIRSASNGADFLARVKSGTGIEVKTIDGEQEALLIYEGVRNAFRLEQNNLIIDIGGGSVEFIICSSDKIHFKQSYPIGAARLMDQFHHSDPITIHDISRLTAYLDSTLYELKQQLEIHRPTVIVGAAGAFETFAVFQEPGFKASFSKPGFDFDYRQFGSIIDMIINSSHAERTNMPQIIPVRVDMIVVAAILISYILEISGIKVLKLSTYSVKEGILFGMLK
ncbi:exopolyphosphatase [Daejeonella sp. JGW-45]|uniref:Ppx/GppA phosphatase family protein n=1 Tax=Daejeonella sp. JGW-45 TaxID=3034148 RepID=UPI0023EAEA2D|nr:exopolyphosphatase [Daejeonella sp. JGW-45]